MREKKLVKSQNYSSQQHIEWYFVTKNFCFTLTYFQMVVKFVKSTVPWWWWYLCCQALVSILCFYDMLFVHVKCTEILCFCKLKLVCGLQSWLHFNFKDQNLFRLNHKLVELEWLMRRNQKKLNKNVYKNSSLQFLTSNSLELICRCKWIIYEKSEVFQFF